VAKVEKPGENKMPIKICWYYPKTGSMLQDLAYWNTNQGRWNLNDTYIQNLDGNLGDYEIKI
jgi:hypothetical protein